MPDEIELEEEETGITADAIAAPQTIQSPDDLSDLVDAAMDEDRGKFDDEDEEAEENNN